MAISLHHQEQVVLVNSLANNLVITLLMMYCAKQVCRGKN